MSQEAKEMIFAEEARLKLSEGIDQLADIVGVTLGPKGLNIGLETSWGAPKITNDGHSIVDDIELKDQYANMGVQMGREMASKVKEASGDGTTTSIILLRALVKEGVKHISAGASPIFLKRELEKAAKKMSLEVDKNALAIKEKKDIERIATVSASGHEFIGKTIFEAIEKVGKEGVITIEEAKGTETTIQMVEGMQFDRGYISSYFCTNVEKMVAEMEDPRILITDKKIGSIQEILGILQLIATTGSELLIIADDIDGDALSTLVVNKLRGTLKVVAVKAPGFGDRKKQLLEDMACLTGSTVISEDTGMKLQDTSIEFLGSAEKILITKDHTTIIGGSGEKEEIEARIAHIEAEINRSTSKYDKEKLEERKAKLSGGVAVIRVGAPTEPEMKQRKQMFEDSLHSTRAALEEGIVIGGGCSLLRASHTLKAESEFHEETIAIDMLKKASEAPFRQIAHNCGIDPSIALQEVLSKAPSFGFNAMTEKVEDLLLVGVIDPAKVIKNGLLHAISTACTLLLSEVLIGDAPEEKESSQA